MLRWGEALEFPRMADYVMDILDEIGVDRAVMVGQSLGSWASQHADPVSRTRDSGGQHRGRRLIAP